MRALFTPTRIIVVVVVFSLLTFLWTYALPHQHRRDHTTKTTGHAAKQTHLPASKQTTPAGHNDDGGRWNDDKESNAGLKPSSVVGASTAPEPTMEPFSSLNPAIATPSPVSTLQPYRHTAAPVKGLCKEVRNAQDVMVVVKTSKAEAHDKLSAHLQGLLSCVPSFAIFSDHQGEIDGIAIHDVLRDISPETKQNNGEFREYTTIQADSAYKPDANKTKDLDKWKILPMVYKAYQMNPHARFYAFVEADTGLSWTNLLQWVDRLDYRIPYYSGAQSFINNVQFAQRGPGILLSQGALRQYSKSYEERWSLEWQKRVAKECCGDYILATALNDAHVELYTSWPLMQGEQPSTLDYTPKQWCAPAVSWHHMDGEALSKSWTLQQKWTDKHGWEKPYLYQNAFDEYVLPHLTAQMEDWDNLSSDTKIVSQAGRQKEAKAGLDHRRAEKERLDHVTTPSTDNHQGGKGGNKDDKKPKHEAEDALQWAAISTMVKDGAHDPTSCAKVCEKVEDCLQWRHTLTENGECHLSKVIKLGKAGENNEGVQLWTSGWMVDRIKETTKKWECKDVNWNFYQ